MLCLLLTVPHALWSSKNLLPPLRLLSFYYLLPLLFALLLVLPPLPSFKEARYLKKNKTLPAFVLLPALREGSNKEKRGCLLFVPDPAPAFGLLPVR